MDFRYIAMALLVLTIVGCTSGQPTSTLKDPFVGGTTGLKLDFVEGAPPDNAYDKGEFPFDVAVQLENVGEYTTTKDDIVVTISGIDPADFGKDLESLRKNPSDNLIKTEKNSEDRVIEGTITTVEFTGLKYLDNLTGNTPFPIRANVCYKYGTTANAKLCYRKDVLGSEKNDLCEVNEDKTVYNSGAPVQVENLKENARGTNKIGFNFDIKHKGTGDIFKRDSTCNGTDRTFEDVVYVTVDTGMGTGMNCSSLTEGDAGYIKLYNGHKTVSCTQEIDNPADFEKSLVITLEYDYEEDKTTEILIKHSTN